MGKIKGKIYLICTKCKIYHFQNCETCFGFGLRLDGTIIKAAEAMGYEELPESIPCPECGSTPLGVDIDGFPNE